jgi:hypothetical protein
MVMPPGLRKLALTIHITASVGWIGAVIAYLCLVVAAFSSEDVQLLRATWPALELIAWNGLAPLAITALVTGLVMALGTHWGVFRHYWVLISLGLTLVATIVLMTQLPQIRAMADLATAGDTVTPRHELAGQLLHAGGGLVVLLVIQVLNVYKPRGITQYGWRKQQEQRTQATARAEVAEPS